MQQRWEQIAADDLHLQERGQQRAGHLAELQLEVIREMEPELCADDILSLS